MTLAGLTAESSSAFFCFSDWFLFFTFSVSFFSYFLMFRPQNQTAHSLNSTLLERMLSYLRKRLKKVSSSCSLCPLFSLPSVCDPRLCSLSYSFSILPHCFSHWKSVMCFCLLPPAPCLSHTCTRVYHSWAPLLFNFYFSRHNSWMPPQNTLYAQKYVDTLLSGLAEPIKGIVC